MKRKNQGRKIHSFTALALAFWLAAAMVLSGELWAAEGVYAADEDTEAADEAAAVSDEEDGSSDTYSESVKIGGAFGDTVGEVEGLEGDFILTYTFYDKSNGTDAWDNFVVEVRNANYTWFDVRADNYGWLYFTSSGYSLGTENITFGDGALDWDVWTTLMQRGQDCTVYVIRHDTTVTIVTQAAGDTFYAEADLDDFGDGCPLYIHLTGESCTLEDVTYTIEYISDWSDENDAMVESLKALAAENDEGGVTIGTGAALDGEEFESTAWWSGVTGVELSSDSSYAVWNYTILVESSISDFGIEVYNEDLTKYITTLTNGDGWYVGLEANDIVASGGSISDSLERGKLYYVTVVRSVDDFTIYYMDSSGDILLVFFATDTNMDETAYVHFYAEYGSFVVAATVGTDTSDTTDDGEYSVEDTETEDTEDLLVDDTDEDSEEVDENLDDDDDEDDDYEIEDLDTEELEDTDTEEEDTEIVVTLEEAVYTSSTWWSGACGSEAAWIGDAVWVYSVTADETYGDDVFSVQVYDDDGNTITFSSDGSAQYDGVTGDAIEVSGDPIVIKAGAEYTVAVSREGTDVWVTFYDEDGNELLSYYAGNTDLADTATSQFYAQIGAYTVNAESSGTEPAGITALTIAAANTDGTSGDSDDGSGDGTGSNKQSGSSSSSVSTAATGDAPVQEILLIALLGIGCIFGTSIMRWRRR